MNARPAGRPSVRGSARLDREQSIEAHAREQPHELRCGLRHHERQFGVAAGSVEAKQGLESGARHRQHARDLKAHPQGVARPRRDRALELGLQTLSCFGGHHVAQDRELKNASPGRGAKKFGCGVDQRVGPSSTARAVRRFKIESNSVHQTLKLAMRAKRDGDGPGSGLATSFQEDPCSEVGADAPLKVSDLRGHDATSRWEATG